MKNIFLIGFMGTGKSTVARHMRREYALEIIEMDELLAKREGMSISKIFQEKGEAYFRDLETELLREIQKKENVVISCGGGVVLREENVALMQESGYVVLLTASPETILQRVKNDTRRPLLQGKKNVQAIRELLEERKERYQSAANFSVCVDKKDSKNVAREIVKQIKGLEK